MAEKKKFAAKVDKRHRGRVPIGLNADGSTRYKFISGKTKGELEENRRRVEAYYVTGVPESQDITIDEFAEKWYQHKTQRVKATTARSLRNSMDNHVVPYFSGRHMKAISSLDIQMFIDGYKGRRKGTVDDVIYCLRQMFRFAKVHGYIASNPTLEIERPKTVAKKTTVLNPELQACVRKVADEHAEGLLLAILFYTGVRRGEMLGLRWEDIDFKNRIMNIKREVVYVSGQITVYEQETDDNPLKTEAAERAIPIPLPLHELLIKSREVAGPVIRSQSGYYLSESSYRRRWQRLMKATGLEEKQYSLINAKCLRKTYSTMINEGGLNEKAKQYVMGHEDYSTTANIYTDVTLKLLLETRDKIDAIYTSK